ncbi:MAG TPA: transglycosylase SLT domain-containing protein [Polyangiaceae bacterium]|nr:transglycosylase SLT domain-containing protein [Polyangiaceae bacterium]
MRERLAWPRGSLRKWRSLHGTTAAHLGRVAWVAFLGCSFIGIARADIHRSVDENGVIVFSSTPRRGSTRVAVDKKQPATHLPSDQSPDRHTRYNEYVVQAATLYQIPVELILAVMQVESNFDPRAVSPVGAQGLMQLMPFTAERMMVTDIQDPRQNIFGGTRYLRILANLFNGDIHLTVAAYNAGEGAVIRYGGIPPYEETRNYVVKVLENYHKYREQSAPR